MSIQPSGAVGDNSEQGMVLLGTVLAAALVLGLAAWGLIDMAGNVQQSIYGESATNQARTAALVGIQSATAYVQSVYVGTNPNTASLADLDPTVAPGLSGGSGLIDQNLAQINNANTQVMVAENTFSSSFGGTIPATGTTGSSINAASSGFIKVLSSGRSGDTIQTAESYLVAQLSTLNNDQYAAIFGGNATLNGGVHNDTGSAIEVGYTPGVTINGNKTGSTGVTYVPITQLPPINVVGDAGFATIELYNGEIIIPASAVPFYESSFSPIATEVATVANDEASGLPVIIAPSSTYGISYSSSTGWTITENIPGFYYVVGSSNNNVTISTTTSPMQMTVATTGTIMVTSSGDTFYPFASPLSSTNGTVDYCSTYSSLPTCGTQAQADVSGLLFLSQGGLDLTSSKSDTFDGDVATAGTLTANGTGSFSFGGITIAEGGLATTKGSSTSTTNGTLTLTAPIAAAKSASLGGYQLTPSSIRWLP